MWPLWGIMVLGAALSVAGYFLLPQPEANAVGVVVNGDFALRVVGLAGVAFVSLVGSAIFLYLLATATLEALGYKGEEVAISCDFGHYIKKVIGWSALTVVTLGVFMPWMEVKMMKYLLAKASYRRRPLGFHAGGMGLFSIIILVALLPVVVGLFLVQEVDIVPRILALDRVTLILAGVLFALVVLSWVSFLLVVLFRWMINMSCGEERVVAKVSLARATLFMMGQILLTIFTLGLYYPMMELRMLQYFAEGTEVVYEGKARRMGFSIRSWRDWAYVWGQMLILCAMGGIYLPWYYARVLNRFVPRAYIED